MKTLKIMMMALMMCFVNLSFGQDSLFRLTKDGLNDFVITKCDNKSQIDLFKKTIEWISVTYKNPSSVIKSQIENNYIRIEGSAGHLVHFGNLGGKSHLTRYQLEISFKDGRYKFEILNIEIYETPIPSAGIRGGWFDFSLTRMFNGTEKVLKSKSYLDDDGEVRPFYKECYKIPDYFNYLNQNLKDFINSENIPSKSNDW
jgi:hypothetical protein